MVGVTTEASWDFLHVNCMQLSKFSFEVSSPLLTHVCLVFLSSYYLSFIYFFPVFLCLCLCFVLFSSCKSHFSSTGDYLLSHFQTPKTVLLCSTMCVCTRTFMVFISLKAIGPHSKKSIWNLLWLFDPIQFVSRWKQSCPELFPKGKWWMDANDTIPCGHPFWELALSWRANFCYFKESVKVRFSLRKQRAGTLEQKIRKRKSSMKRDEETNSGNVRVSPDRRQEIEMTQGNEKEVKDEVEGSLVDMIEVERKGITRKSHVKNRKIPNTLKIGGYFERDHKHSMAIFKHDILYKNEQQGVAVFQNNILLCQLSPKGLGIFKIKCQDLIIKAVQVFWAKFLLCQDLWPHNFLMRTTLKFCKQKFKNLIIDVYTYFGPNSYFSKIHGTHKVLINANYGLQICKQCLLPLDYAIELNQFSSLTCTHVHCAKFLLFQNLCNFLMNLHTVKILALYYKQITSYAHVYISYSNPISPKYLHINISKTAYQTVSSKFMPVCTFPTITQFAQTRQYPPNYFPCCQKFQNKSQFLPMYQSKIIPTGESTLANLAIWWRDSRGLTRVPTRAFHFIFILIRKASDSQMGAGCGRSWRNDSQNGRLGVGPRIFGSVSPSPILNNSEKKYTACSGRYIGRNGMNFESSKQVGGLWTQCPPLKNHQVCWHCVGQSCLPLGDLVKLGFGNGLIRVPGVKILCGHCKSSRDCKSRQRAGVVLLTCVGTRGSNWSDMHKNRGSIPWRPLATDISRMLLPTLVTVALQCAAFLSAAYIRKVELGQGFPAQLHSAPGRTTLTPHPNQRAGVLTFGPFPSSVLDHLAREMIRLTIIPSPKPTGFRIPQYIRPSGYLIPAFLSKCCADQTPTAARVLRGRLWSDEYKRLTINFCSIRWDHYEGLESSHAAPPSLGKRKRPLDIPQGREMTLNGLKRWPADPELELKFSQSDNWEWKHHAINGADLTLGQPNRHALTWTICFDYRCASLECFHQGVRTGNSKNEDSPITNFRSVYVLITINRRDTVPAIAPAQDIRPGSHTHQGFQFWEVYRREKSVTKRKISRVFLLCCQIATIHRQAHIGRAPWNPKFYREGPKVWQPSGRCSMLSTYQVDTWKP
ncbi:hypothetical protein VP01_2119g3 [Puccinia sorghi]|uniref:Uncharacterized protein n=1 Tax=Puccinia sorghi TaxID=27349 RepID=A0A0L6V9X0_9BASI|nr:hypothetical protein VP01_2119g3 [Puccinia sorghi]